MLSEFYIDGFKSLKDFSISFNNGLNVFIGPNGAGKSNICQALGMLAAAAEGPLSTYILSLGGASATFTAACSIDKSEKINKSIKIRCKGITTDKLKKKDKEDEEFVLKYEYLIEIAFMKDIRILHEKFRLLKKSNKNRFKNILMATRNKKQEVLVEVKDLDEIGPVAISMLKKEKKNSIVLDQNPLESFLPMLGGLYYFCHKARLDLLFLKSWNIDPNVAKKSSDILESSKMHSNGKRLANTIHEMFNSKRNKLNQINEIISRILPGYSKVEPSTSNELGTRTYRVIDDRGVQYPAQCLSDGTVKALALLVAVVGLQHNTSIVEEPENYLHPWACQLLIDFFREYFEEGVLILTTHSETILNSIRPSEIVIVENIEGTTKCNRLADEKNLTEAIKDSGFGCGYHYLAGSLGGTPE